LIAFAAAEAEMACEGVTW